MENPYQEEHFRTILEYLKLNHESLKLLWKKIDSLEKELTNSDFKMKKKKRVPTDEEKKKRKERWDEMIEKSREEYPNAWKSWSEEQDEELLVAHNEGKSIEEITKIMGRSHKSIIKRLEKKGIVIDESES